MCYVKHKNLHGFHLNISLLYMYLIGKNENHAHAIQFLVFVIHIPNTFTLESLKLMAGQFSWFLWYLLPKNLITPLTILKTVFIHYLSSISPKSMQIGPYKLKSFHEHTLCLKELISLCDMFCESLRFLCFKHFNFINFYWIFFLNCATSKVLVVLIVCNKNVSDNKEIHWTAYGSTGIFTQ